MLRKNSGTSPKGPFQSRTRFPAGRPCGLYPSSEVSDAKTKGSLPSSRLPIQSGRGGSSGNSSVHSGLSVPPRRPHPRHLGKAQQPFGLVGSISAPTAGRGAAGRRGFPAVAQAGHQHQNRRRPAPPSPTQATAWRRRASTRPTASWPRAWRCRQ